MEELGRLQPTSEDCETSTHLVRHAAVCACIPRDQVLHHLLDPTTLLGAQILSGETHIPVWTGAQHGQEGHDVAGPVHREFSRGGSTPGNQKENRVHDLFFIYFFSMYFFKIPNNN